MSSKQFQQTFSYNQRERTRKRTSLMVSRAFLELQSNLSQRPFCFFCLLFTKNWTLPFEAKIFFFSCFLPFFFAVIVIFFFCLFPRQMQEGLFVFFQGVVDTVLSLSLSLSLSPSLELFIYKKIVTPKVNLSCIEH